jgi:hypothetical protein
VPCWNYHQYSSEALTLQLKELIQHFSSSSSNQYRKIESSKEAKVEFFSSAIFTSFFVVVTVLARKNEVGKMTVLIGLPTAIALYFATFFIIVT